MAVGAGDQAAAAEARKRLRERAIAADEAGSADGALVLAQLQHVAGDDVGSLAAWKRADQRGSVPGMLQQSQVLLAMGDLDGAEAAARRTEAAGSCCRRSRA